MELLKNTADIFSKLFFTQLNIDVSVRHWWLPSLAPTLSECSSIKDWCTCQILQVRWYQSHPWRCADDNSSRVQVLGNNPQHQPHRLEGHGQRPGNPWGTFSSDQLRRATSHTLCQYFPKVCPLSPSLELLHSYEVCQLFLMPWQIPIFDTDDTGWSCDLWWNRATGTLTVGWIGRSLRALETSSWCSWGGRRYLYHILYIIFILLPKLDISLI